MITILVKKDDATIIPVQKATLEDAEAFCATRADVVEVRDADGNAVSFPSSAVDVAEVQDAPPAEPPVEAPIEPAPANE